MDDGIKHGDTTHAGPTKYTAGLLRPVRVEVRQTLPLEVSPREVVFEHLNSKQSLRPVHFFHFHGKQSQLSTVGGMRALPPINWVRLMGQPNPSHLPKQLPIRPRGVLLQQPEHEVEAHGRHTLPAAVETDLARADFARAQTPAHGTNACT